jgi:hypothetical protein
VQQKEREIGQIYQGRGMLAPIRPQRGSTNHSRPILFFHIPKTGGSSVSVAFQRVLGARKVLVPLYGSDREIIGHALNQAALSASPLFMSGHISPGIFDSHPWIVRTTVVRDPVDLLISQFCYSYKTRYQSPINLEFLQHCAGYRDARFSGEDVERWIDSCSVDNPQARFLSRSGTGTADAQMAVKAQDALDGCELVGITEELPNYMSVLAHMAGAGAPEAVHINRPAHGIIDEDPRRLHQRLQHYVALDTSLYSHAKERFEQSKARFLLQMGSPELVRTGAAGELTFRERLQAWYWSSAVEKRERLSRRFRMLKNVTSEFLASNSANSPDEGGPHRAASPIQDSGD